MVRVKINLVEIIFTDKNNLTLIFFQILVYFFALLCLTNARPQPPPEYTYGSPPFGYGYGYDEPTNVVPGPMNPDTVVYGIQAPVFSEPVNYPYQPPQSITTIHYPETSTTTPHYPEPTTLHYPQSSSTLHYPESSTAPHYPEPPSHYPEEPSTTPCEDLEESHYQPYQPEPVVNPPSTYPVVPSTTPAPYEPPSTSYPTTTQSHYPVPTTTVAHYPSTVEYTKTPKELAITTPPSVPAPVIMVVSPPKTTEKPIPAPVPVVPVAPVPVAPEPAPVKPAVEKLSTNYVLFHTAPILELLKIKHELYRLFLDSLHHHL